MDREPLTGWARPATADIESCAFSAVRKRQCVLVKKLVVTHWSWRPSAVRRFTAGVRRRNGTASQPWQRGSRASLCGTSRPSACHERGALRLDPAVQPARIQEFEVRAVPYDRPRSARPDDISARRAGLGRPSLNSLPNVRVLLPTT